MKLRKLARQLAAAAVAGAMALSLCMPALAQTWDISNQPGFSEVYSITVTGTTGARTVELFGGGSSLSQTETDETVLSGSGATFISLRGVRCAGGRDAGGAGHQAGGLFPQRRLHPHRR